jgi:hypothetical protein
MSTRNPFSDLVQTFGKALGTLVELAEQAEQFKKKSGEAPKVEAGFRARTLDGSSLNDLKELASKLQAVGQPEPAPAPAPRQLAVELHQEADAIVALVLDAPARPSRFECKVDGDVLSLFFEEGGQRFVAEAHLPEPVDDAHRELRFRPGLVELRWPRRGA